MPPLKPPGRGSTGGRFIAFLVAVALLAGVAPVDTAAGPTNPADVVGSDRHGETAVGSQASIGLGSDPAIDPFDQLDPDDDEDEDDEEGGDDDGDDEEADGGDDEDDRDEDDRDEDDGDDDRDVGDDERGNAGADDDSDAAGPPFGEGPPDESGVGDFVETVLTEIAGGPEDDGPEDGDEGPSGSGEADGSGSDDGAGDAAGDVDAAESEPVEGEGAGDEASGPPAPDGDGFDGEPASQVEEPTPTRSPTPTRILVDDVSTNRSVVAGGEPVSITATLVNTGDVTGSRDVRLRLFGEVVDARAVTVPANGEREVSFVRTIVAPGTYEATVGNASASVTVEATGTTTTPDAEPASQETPGFTVLAALLGVVVAALLIRLRSG